MELTQEIVKKYIDEIILSSRKAGAAIMEIYNQEDFGIQSKSDDSPLTKADLAANKILCETLKRISPDIPIISEENETISYMDRAGWEYCWVVDPLDGTKEFIKRNGEFTTNVALVSGDSAVAGVIFAPAIDEMYWGIYGNGAYSEIKGEIVKMQVKSYTKADKKLKLVCSRSHLNEATQAIVDEYDEPELIASGSSLKFMKIAKGDAHVYPRMAPTMEWDTCAAQAILEEAGGYVLQADTLEPVVYNKENLLNPSFIALANQQD
ncbi:MAG: 3'(2'), 5'-bisphosphate nucleotidase [Saprospiraceae bacterium]|jgi:3'(2'), 5'-bisphosphate nucleotidase